MYGSHFSAEKVKQLIIEHGELKEEEGKPVHEIRQKILLEKMLKDMSRNTALKYIGEAKEKNLISETNLMGRGNPKTLRTTSP